MDHATMACACMHDALSLRASSRHYLGILQLQCRRRSKQRRPCVAVVLLLSFLRLLPLSAISYDHGHIYIQTTHHHQQFRRQVGSDILRPMNESLASPPAVQAGTKRSPSKAGRGAARMHAVGGLFVSALTSERPTDIHAGTNTHAVQHDIGSVSPAPLLLAAGLLLVPPITTATATATATAMAGQV